MLKITICDGSESSTLKLEGKLAGPWVEELEKSWNAIARSPKATRLLADLCAVTFVDAQGEHLLARMHQAGVDLAAVGPMTRYIIEKIKRGQNGHTRESRE